MKTSEARIEVRTIVSNRITPNLFFTVDLLKQWPTTHQNFVDMRYYIFSE